MIEEQFNQTLDNKKSYLDYFVNLYLKNKLPQAFLLSGEKGIGKLNFIYHLVNFILSQNEENKYDLKSYSIKPDNKTFKLLSQNSHPNFFLISPRKNKKNIEISQIKEMQTYLNMTSFNKIPKIILINGSEYLNLSSSNSLLKSLEEINKNVFFILIHDVKKYLIPTIKSRCIKFNFILNENERINRINDLLNNQYDILSNDFKNKYINPIFFRDLLNYCETNDLNIKNINLETLLDDIFTKQNFKKNEFLTNNFFSLVQLYIYKCIKHNLDKERYFSILKYFTKRFDDVIKYNLDFESYVLEFKYLIYNEK